MAQKHGGRFDPNAFNQYTTPQPRPANRHGGQFDPNAYTAQTGTRPHPASIPQQGQYHQSEYEKYAPQAPQQFQQQQGQNYELPAQAQQQSYHAAPAHPTHHQYQSPPPPAMSGQPHARPAHSGAYNNGSIPLQQVPYNGGYEQPAYGYGNHQAQQHSSPQPPKEGFMGKAPAVNVHEMRPVKDAQRSSKSEREFPTPLKGGHHIWNSSTQFRWKRPHHYQMGGWQYLAREIYRHVDFAGREKKLTYSDRYLHHNDGYLRNLIVACTDELFEAQGNTTWRRTYIRSAAPLKIRIATWVIDFSYDPESWQDWSVQLLRAVPAAFAMAFVLAGSSDSSHTGINYAPVNYEYHGDAKVWSNMHENRNGLSRLARSSDVYRLLRPRYLCLLRNPYDDGTKGPLPGMDIIDVEAYLVNNPNAAEDDLEHGGLSYIFVAYTQAHFSHGIHEQMIALHRIAEIAARKAKVAGYWLSASCMRDEAQGNDDVEEDVYRIADVLRGAHDMIIAVSEYNNNPAYNNGGKKSVDEALAEFGSRMWTFPEVLLSPGRSVDVWVSGREGEGRATRTVPKNQFALRAWSQDHEEARHLVDHYLGSTNLSRLELAILALRCLYNRRTTEKLPGDHAYALMGLLRLRPQIDKTDTQFQAFARLSLANDSDRLVERYLCTLPKTPTQVWYDMKDAYDSALWDIDPCIQVAGIGDHDTVIVDGAYGASVRWKGFFYVGWLQGLSWKRNFARILMHYNGYFFIVAVAMFAISRGSATYAIIGIIFLGLYLYILLLTPKLVRICYGGKMHDVQAALFAFEGYLNASTVERAIFGGAFKRMKYSRMGSPLCRSYVNEHGERVGMDPSKDIEVRRKIEAARHAKPGGMRVFTLVDTYNMEITLFEAIRPPTVFMFCAAEGGMQRAVGCSYDFTTETFYRETVLRLPTPCLNRTYRVPRFRLGISRKEMPSRPAAVAV